MKTLPEYITLLQSYMQQNASKYGILRMGIFGSVARNEHTDVSDVDVYVEGQLHGFFALAGIKAGFGRTVRLQSRYCSLARQDGFIST